MDGPPRDLTIPPVKFRPRFGGVLFCLDLFNFKTDPPPRKMTSFFGGYKFEGRFSHAGMIAEGHSYFKLYVLPVRLNNPHTDQMKTLEILGSPAPLSNDSEAEAMLHVKHNRGAPSNTRGNASEDDYPLSDDHKRTMK